MLHPLLLKNAAVAADRNACFANCIIQILRRIPHIKEVVTTLAPETMIHSELKQIFLAEGTLRKISASKLRAAVGREFSSGAQMDCKEFFDCLLEGLPFGFDELFSRVHATLYCL